jgi:fermentation-respiration switch protein FrsA (DUF1100 family)
MILALVILICCAAVYWIYKQSMQVLGPTYKKRPLAVFPDQFKVPFENINFTTSDNIKIKGWFIPCAGSTKTIFLMHGWGQNRGDIFKYTYILRDWGFNLVYFDFRAMGESGGSGSSIGYLETKDIEAAVKYIKAARPAACESIGLYGVSMGAAAAVYYAAKNKNIKCLVCEASYFSYNRVVARWAWINKRMPYFPVIPLVLFFIRRRLGFDPEQYSPAYNVGALAGRPLFIIHGRSDNLVPAVNATKLFKAAGEPKELWIIPGAKHNQCAEIGGEEYRYRLVQFFTKNL